MKTISIFGAPGTGKTTYLTNLINELAKTTLSIVVLSYSKSSAREIQSRLKHNKILKVKTCHSLAFEINEYQTSQVLTQEKIEEMRLTDFYFNNLARKDFYEMLAILNLGVEKLQTSYEEYMGEFVNRYNEYKRINMLISFSDMLAKSNPFEKYDYVIVDEAQDMTPLNWSFIQKLPNPDGTIYLAGDDDQNIYNFNGSNEQIMVDEADEKIILEQSYRLPRAIHELSQKHVRSISKRQEKIFNHNDNEGSVQHLTYIDPTKLAEPATLLFRDNYSMREFESELISKFVPYKKAKSKSYFDSYFADTIRAWYKKDRAYLEKNIKFFIEPYTIDDVLEAKHWRDVLEAPFIKVDFLEYIYNVDLFADCNIKLSTIHNFKGLEDNHIILFTDLPNRTSLEYYKQSDKEIDSEKRVWYVGLTRSKNKLTLIGTNRYLEL